MKKATGRLRTQIFTITVLLAGSAAFANSAAKAPATTSVKTPAAKTVTTAPAPAAKLETAQLAAGCFWGVEESFRTLPGVMATQVGYEGGAVESPSYEQVSAGSTGNAETVEIQYDPSKVSYETLLDHFFKMHDPTTLNRQGNDHGTQYRSAIFYRNEEQKKAAEAFIAKVEKSGAWKAKVTTTLEGDKKFYPAEDYHQKYLVKHPGGYDNHYMRKISFDAPKP